MSDSLTTGLTQEQHLLRASISQILVKNGLRTDQVAILELVRLMEDYKNAKAN